MQSKQHVIISANPKSGSHNRHALVEQLRQAIEQSGFHCELLTDLALVSARSRELADEGLLRTVIAAGGDGTASTVASLIPMEIPLTLFPTGSENLLAKYFGIKADVKSCALVVARGRTRTLDVMQVNGKLALLMASVGFDAEVVRRVHQSRKSHITRWSYWSAILAALACYRWPTLNVRILDSQGGLIESTNGNWVFVFNVPRYAAGIAIMEDAIEDDGYLDIGIFDQGGLFHGLWCYWNVCRGSHHRMKQWRRFRAHAIVIESNAEGASCQMDGDWACPLPVAIELAPRKLALMV